MPNLVAGEEELLYDHRTAGVVVRQPRDAGWAWRCEAAREWSRAASGFDVLPGTGLSLHAEARTGELEWLRLEAGAPFAPTP